MGMILAPELLCALHIHSRNAEVAGLGSGQADFTPAVLGTRDFRLGNPTFLETLPHVAAEVLVVWIARAIFFIQTGLKLFARGSK